jgi:hypothetical protein
VISARAAGKTLLAALSAWAGRAILAACLVLAVWGVVDYRSEIARRKAVMADGLLTPADANSPKALDVYHQAVAAGLFRELAGKAPDILYLNDSVMGGHGDFEPRTPMDELLATALNGNGVGAGAPDAQPGMRGSAPSGASPAQGGKTGEPAGAAEARKASDARGAKSALTVRGVSGAGYTALVFERYARLVARSPHRPRIVILPLNPRSFSSPWFFGEDYWYSRVLRFLPLIAETPSLTWWLSRLPDRINGRDPDAVAGKPFGDGFKVPAVENYFSLFRPGSPDYGPPPPGLTEERLAAREHFIENYGLVKTTAGHPMLGAMILAARKFERAGVTPVIYVTPVDLEEGERLLGPLFAARFREGIAVIQRELEREGVAFLDLSGLLGSRFFVDREYACEHLNLAGREAVAVKLAEAVRPMLDR